MLTPYRSVVAKRRQSRGSRLWLLCLRHPMWLFYSGFITMIPCVVAIVGDLPYRGVALLTMWCAWALYVFAIMAVVHVNAK